MYNINVSLEIVFCSKKYPVIRLPLVVPFRDQDRLS